MSIFKSNDIRGLYPKEWDSDTAYRIGLAFSVVIQGSRIVIGRDGRNSSDEIFTFLTKGLVESGMEISDLGIVDTPAVYFSVGTYGFDGGIMITASHNPVGYNGLKLTGRNAIPIVSENGLKRIEEMVGSISHNSKPNRKRGRIVHFDIQEAYVNYLAEYKEDYSDLNAVFDCSNGAAGRFASQLLADFQGNAVIINNTIDGQFPAHGPNPSAEGSIDQLREKVLESGSAVGFCFDGDADRVVMVDDKGSIVSPDLVTALLGQYFTEKEKMSSPESKVLVDIRSSNAVSEYLKTIGALPLKCPAGHARIKRMLREEDAVCAGELTGHYYYRDNFYCDSAWITVFILLNILSSTGEKLSYLKKRIMKYAFSGEISFPFESSGKQEQVISQLLERYSTAEIEQVDGFRFNFSNWWFIVRKSGTEPLLRIVVEAEESGEMEKRVKSLSKEIMEFTG